MCDAYLLEHENFSTDFPPTQLPATEDVCHVVIHPVYKEEVPTFETL
jgi:hypothetical protein